MTANTEPLVVTLDGPAGVGKSTLAKRLAEALSVAYLDTGAMFRAIALHLSRLPGSGGADADAPIAAGVLKDCIFALEGSGAETRLLYNGKALGMEIRTEEVGMKASNIAKRPEVREFLKTAQRTLGARFSLVAEGRDMGTVVFPGAACKIFLDASPEVRAERRYKQLQEMGEPCDLATLAEQIRQRDEQDRNRAVAPLRPADDAVIVDTSGRNIDEVFAAVMDAVAARRFGPAPERTMRRKDRALERAEAEALLAGAEYGVLAVDEGSGRPYAVPLSFVVGNNGALYFHSAGEGRKLDALAKNPRVCFTVVGKTLPIYTKNFTTYFESAMVFGCTFPVEDPDEKFEALMRLAEKYLPEHMDKAEPDIRHSFSRTAVFKLVPELITGKAKREKKKA